MRTKRIMVAILALAIFCPSVALAGSSTDAALGLGAFAVFNQMLAGTGVFGLGYAAPPPVVVAPPPPPVVVAPAPVVVAPPPVTYYYPAPVYYAPARYYPAPVYYAPARAVIVPGWCRPHGKHGRC